MKDDARDGESTRQSSFVLLWCKMTFSSEPLWFRLVVMVIIAFGNGGYYLFL